MSALDDIERGRDAGARLYSSWRASGIGRECKSDPMWDELDPITKRRWVELARAYNIGPGY